MSVITFLYLYAAFLLLFILAWSGYVINIWFAIKATVGVLVDVGRHLWIDLCKIPRLFAARKRRRVELDEYERHLS